MSAFSVVSEKVLPFDCRAGMLLKSFLECLSNVNNFLVSDLLYYVVTWFGG